jgi:hypothetical protein
MRLNKLLAILFVACLFSVAATLLFYSFYYVIDVKETNMKLVVADYMGFDLNPVNLTFGATEPGGSSQRNLIINNVYNEPIRVRIRLSGDLAPIVGLSGKDFIMEKGEKRTIVSAAKVPEDWKNGTYFGKARVIFTKPW